VWAVFATLMIALIIGTSVFWLWMLVDCLSRPERKFKGKNDKLIWILLMIFFWVLGSILYFFMVKEKKGKR